MTVLPSGMPVARFLAELRDREVYHTGVAYGAGAFIIWQAADIVFPALGFPPSAMRFLVVAAMVGFPMALVLSWLYRLVPERQVEMGDAGGQSGVPAAGRPGGVRFRRLRRSLLVVAVSSAFVACAGIAWTALPHSRMAFPQGHELLIATFANHTGDSLFEGTLGDALEVGLAQSPHLKLMPRSEVERVLAEMRRPVDAELDEATAIEVGLRSSAAAVLAPSIDRVGDRFRLTTRLIDPENGATVVARSATAVGLEQVLPTLDELARQLRADLGEPLHSLVSDHVSLDHATTSSLDALKAWTEGNRQWRAGRQHEAGLLFQRAVELDSAFAVAYADLGQFYYWVQDDVVNGARCMAAARRHGVHATERERLLIDAKAAEWGGDRERAASVYRALVDRYPNDEALWRSLAYQYFRLGRYDEAIKAYERVVAVDSLSGSAWLNLASIRSSLGDRDSAATLYQKAFALVPGYRTVNNINHEWGFVFVATRRWAEAERAFRLMLEGTASQQAQGHRSLGELRLAMGRLNEAARQMRQAVLLSRAAGQYVAELRNRTLLVESLHYGGRSVQGEWAEARNLAVRRAVPTYFVAVLGEWLARNGRVEAARQLLDTARVRSNGSREDRSALERLAGEIAKATGDARSAGRHFEASLTIFPDDRVARFALADLLESQGDFSGAESFYRDITDRPLSSNEFLAPGILAHYRLARVLEASGRREEAAVSYRRFLEFWGDGDAGIPQVEEARNRLRALPGVDPQPPGGATPASVTPPGPAPGTAD